MRHRFKFRRWAAIGLILLLFTSLVQLATTNVAAADTVWDVPAQQFNMCGHSCAVAMNNPADYQLVELEVDVADPGPWIVTLNEVCSWDLNQGLMTFMEDRGYTYDRYISKYEGGKCGYYGTAMFTLGGNASIRLQYNLTPYNGESRALMCRHKSTYAGPVLMCETHLMTQEQNNEAFLHYESTLYEPIALIGGDFNKTPYSSSGFAMLNWYTNSYEMDPPNHVTYSTDPHLSLSQKIDYMFNRMNSFRSGSTYCGTWAYSDHCYYYGNFYFST